jgi:hypothetical protein
MRSGCDTDELLDLITDELMKRTHPAALIAYLDDRRTKASIDEIHQRGTLAMRAALEDAIAAAKARVRQQETNPCPI